MGNVWRLVRAYVWRMDRGTTFYVACVLVPLMLAWILVPDSDAAAWFFDWLRSLAAAAPFVGPFFRSPEVAGRPVSRDDLWRAQWLVATVGVTVAICILRLAAGAIGGGLQGRLVVQSTIVDFFGSIVSAGLAAMLLHPGKPRLLRTLPAAIITFAAALAIVFAAPVWSSSLRAALAARATPTTIVGIGISCLAALAIALLAVPRSRAVVRQGALQWYEAGGARSHAREDAAWWARRSHDSGADRWIARKLRSAVVIGMSVVVCSAAVVSFLPQPDAASTTFVQRLAGQFVEGGDFLAPMMVTCGAVIWTVGILDNLRLVRLVPLSRLAIAVTLASGILLSVLVSTGLQIAAYRVGFGFWPPTLQIPIALGAVCLAALSKSAYLILPTPRSVAAGLVIAMMPLVLELERRWLAPFALVPAVTLCLAVVLLLVPLDVRMLERSSHLYRVNPATL